MSHRRNSRTCRGTANPRCRSFSRRCSGRVVNVLRYFVSARMYLGNALLWVATAVTNWRNRLNTSGLRSTRRHWHGRNGRPSNQCSSLLGRLFWRQAGLLVHGEKAPTGQFPAASDTSQTKGRPHDFGLDQLGTIENPLRRRSWAFGAPPGTRTLTVAPLPPRSHHWLLCR
jgi:hypothetical protein